MDGFAMNLLNIFYHGCFLGVVYNIFNIIFTHFLNVFHVIVCCKYVKSQKALCSAILEIRKSVLQNLKQILIKLCFYCCQNHFFYFVIITHYFFTSLIFVINLVSIHNIQCKCILIDNIH